MDYWFCPMCGEKYNKNHKECLICSYPDLGYVDQIGGIHEGGCGTMPDGTDCGECSKGDCSFCSVWAEHWRRKMRYIKFICPECGAETEIWYEKTIDSMEVIAGHDQWPYEKVDLIYHCTECGRDYSSVWETMWGDTMQTKPERKYWG